MAKYHINKSGEPKPCNAAYKCPFGSAEEHHDTAEAARDAYEKEMTTQLVPEGASKKDIGLRDLTKLARVSSDKEVLSDAVERGSDRTYRALSENRHMTPDLLSKAADKSSSSETRKRLVAHKNFPVAKMTGDDAAELYNPHQSWENARLEGSNDLNDEHVSAIKKKHPRASLDQAVSNPNNKVSNETAIKLAQNKHSIGSLMRGNRITGEYIGDLPAKDVYWGDIYKETNPEYLDGFATSSLKGAKSEDAVEREKAHYNATHVAKNEHTSPRTLHRLTEGGVSLREVYENPNTEPETRELAISSDPDLARRAHLDDLDQSLPGGLMGSLRDDSSTSYPSGRNRGYSVTEVKFNTSKMKELGVDSEDIHILMDSRRFNAGARFDEETGVFRGAVDSTD